MRTAIHIYHQRLDSQTRASKAFTHSFDNDRRRSRLIPSQSAKEGDGEIRGLDNLRTIFVAESAA